MQQAHSNASTDSQIVELEISINEQTATPEDYRLRDVKRWQFRRMNQPRNISYIYVENGSLFAYTTTPREVPMNPAPTNRPFSTTAGHFIPVRTAPPPGEVMYGEPYHRVPVMINDLTAVGQYVIKAHIEGSEGSGSRDFLLHVDTCSDYSWIYAFDRGNRSARYDSEHTSIPTFKFHASYVDGGRVSGAVCKATASFDQGRIRLDGGWTFGAALEANEKFLKNRASDGILALSFIRPSSFPDYDNQTFVEYLMQHGYIREYMFTIKIRRNERSTITFGNPPEFEESPLFFQKVVDSRWALPCPKIRLTMGGETSFKDLQVLDESGRLIRRNAAIFDTGATYVYLQPEIVASIYTTFCEGPNFFEADGSYYVRAEVTRNEAFNRASIRFYFGDISVTLGAKFILGLWSHKHRAFMGAFQARGEGSWIDNADWTYDVYGTSFFKYVSVVFSAGFVDPQIAIR